MAKLLAGEQAYHITIDMPEGDTLGLILVSPPSPQGQPNTVDGHQTPADTSSPFQAGGVPREWNSWDNAGYSTFDPQNPTGYSWVKNLWPLTPGVITVTGKLTEIALPNSTHPLGPILDAVEINTHLYLTAGPHALKIPNGYQDPTVVQDFVSLTGLTSYSSVSVCLYQGLAYWGGRTTTIGAAHMVQHTTGNDTFTVSSVAFPGSPEYAWNIRSFQGIDGNNNWAEWLIWSVQGDTAVKYTSSTVPLNASNNTPGNNTGITIGSPSFSISRIETSRQAPYIVKQDGVFAFQRLGAYRPNITPEWLAHSYQYNGVSSMIVNGKLYANLLAEVDEVQGLDGQLNDVINNVQPGVDTPNRTPVAGQVWAMCPWRGWRVMAVYNTTTETSYICFGKPREEMSNPPPGTSRWIWHMAPFVIEGERVTWMKVTAPFGQQRLWIATRDPDDTTTRLFWASLPRDGDVIQDLLNGGPWRASLSTGILYLGADPWGAPITTKKVIADVAVVSQNCSQSAKITPLIRADGGDRQPLSSSVVDSPYQRASIVNEISGYRMAPEVEIFTDNETTPPYMEALRIRSRLAVETSKTKTMRVQFGNGVRLRGNQGDDPQDPEVTFNRLLSLQDGVGRTMTDQYGKTILFALNQGGVWKEREVRDASQWSIEAVFEYVEIAHVWAWGDGTTYDANEVWA